MSPLDILYIVLAFCALWLTAAIFWLVWQVAMIIKNVNDAVHTATDAMGKIEVAISAIRDKFDNTTATLGTVVSATARIVDYVMDRNDKPEKKIRSKKKKPIDV